MSRMQKALALVLSALFLCSCGNNTVQEMSPVSDGKVEITIAVRIPNSCAKGLIHEFNMTSEKYKARPVSYEQLEGMDILRTEIIAGKAPDVFAFFDQTLTSAYENLLPYLDSDPKLSRENFVPSLLNAAMQGEKLLLVPLQFELDTYYMRESLLPDDMPMTMENANHLAQEQGISLFPQWITKEHMLNRIKSFSFKRFVDYSQGNCDFENPEFIALLEQCMAQPEELPEDESTWRKSLLIDLPLQEENLLKNPKYSLGEDYCYVGFPTPDGGQSSFDIMDSLSINTASAHKEGAWEFVRFALSEAGQEHVKYSFPFNMAVLEARLHDELKKGIENADPDIPAVNQSDIDKFMDLLMRTTVVAGGDMVISNIISEEASAFFAGERSAEEVARLIQSRVSLYLAEQG